MKFTNQFNFDQFIETKQQILEKKTSFESGSLKV